MSKYNIAQGCTVWSIAHLHTIMPILYMFDTRFAVCTCWNLGWDAEARHDTVSAHSLVEHCPSKADWDLRSYRRAGRRQEGRHFGAAPYATILAETRGDCSRKGVIAVAAPCHLFAGYMKTILQYFLIGTLAIAISRCCVLNAQCTCAFCSGAASGVEPQ